MESRLMLVRKAVVVFLSVLAIFALLALIRHENQMLVSDNENNTEAKTPVKVIAAVTRDV